MKRDVLFFDFAYEEYLPIIEHSVQQGIRPIMNQPKMRGVLQARGTETRQFLAFASGEDGQAAGEQARQIGERFAETVAVPGAIEPFETATGNLLVHGGSDLARRILEMVENQILIARIMERLLQQEELGAVVMRSCLSAGQRTIQAVAGRAGVPVIELSHGNPAWRKDLSPPERPWHFAAFGSRELEALVGMGSRPELVSITGAAHWDPLYTPEARLTRREARHRLGIPHDLPLLVYAGGFASGGTLFFAQKALRLIKGIEMFAAAIGRLKARPMVALRPHPGESRQRPGRRPTAAEMADFRAWFAAKGANLVHIDYSDTSLIADKACLLRAADAVVVSDASSTIVTEVLILGRPCVVLEDQDSPFRRFYSESDGVLAARDAAELTGILDEILESSERRRALRAAAESALPELNFGHDGKASERVARLVSDIAAAPPLATNGSRR